MYGYTKPLKQYEVPPVGYVHNVKPLGRIARLKTRETLEKEAIKARVGGFERHGNEVDRPIETDENSHMYMSETDRFSTNASAELKATREVARQLEEQRINRIREQTKARDEQRFRVLAEEAERAASRLNTPIDRGQGRLAPGLNSVGNSIPYNPITLAMNDSIDAEHMRMNDAEIHHRAHLRQRHLREQQNKNGYNVITGCNIDFGLAPEKPNPFRKTGPIGAVPQGDRSNMGTPMNVVRPTQQSQEKSRVSSRQAFVNKNHW